MAIERVEYDEFGLFADNASEFGLPYEGPPTVRREFVAVDGDRRLSALVWGTEPPELVFLHGGAQNAHTWDTVALALGRPLVAIDLPGHGHSDGGKEGQLDLADNAADVAVVIRGAGARRQGRDRHVARRDDDDRAGPPGARPGALDGARRHHARRDGREGQGDHRLRQRAGVVPARSRTC